MRKAEYKRLTDRADRKFIKGQKYVLLSHHENLSPEKRRRLQTLLAANKRLHTAHVLKEVRAAVGLPARGMGPEVLRPMARGAALAAAQAVREVCEPDRTALGGHHRLLPTGEQSRARLRRRAEQQDSRHPAPLLRPARRRLPAPEDPRRCHDSKFRSIHPHEIPKSQNT